MVLRNATVHKLFSHTEPNTGYSSCTICYLKKKKNQRLTEVITKVSITVCSCIALSWKIHIVTIHVTVSTWFWRQVLSYFLPTSLTLLDSWNIFSITFLWLRFSISSSMTNFVGYVIPLSRGYEQMPTQWSAPWHRHKLSVVYPNLCWSYENNAKKQTWWKQT